MLGARSVAARERPQSAHPRYRRGGWGTRSAGHHLYGMVKRTLRKTTKQRVRDDGWRLPDVLWAKIEPLLPARPKHPLGCHNPRVPDRAAMDAIFFVLRTGCQWNALNVTGICSSSSAHRRFVEWAEAGVFQEFWRQGLLAYDEV